MNFHIWSNMYCIFSSSKNMAPSNTNVSHVTFFFFFFKVKTKITVINAVFRDTCVYVHVHRSPGPPSSSTGAVRTPSYTAVFLFICTWQDTSRSASIINQRERGRPGNNVSAVTNPAPLSCHSSCHMCVYRCIHLWQRGYLPNHCLLYTSPSPRDGV